MEPDQIDQIAQQRVAQQIGGLTLQNINLSVQLEAARLRIAELEQAQAATEAGDTTEGADATT